MSYIQFKCYLKKYFASNNEKAFIFSKLISFFLSFSCLSANLSVFYSFFLYISSFLCLSVFLPLCIFLSLYQYFSVLWRVVFIVVCLSSTTCSFHSFFLSSWFSVLFNIFFWSFLSFSMTATASSFILSFPSFPFTCFSNSFFLFQLLVLLSRHTAHLSRYVKTVISIIGLNNFNILLCVCVSLRC